MVSKRKQKKAEKKAGTNPGTANSTSPETTVGKKPPKHIIGFGQKTDADHIHAISNVDNSALCDIRIKEIPIKKELNANDCTCTRCSKFAAYKELYALESKLAPDRREENGRRDDDKKKVSESKTPVKAKAKPAPDKDAGEEVDESDEIYEQIKQRIDLRFKRLETRLLKKTKEYIDSEIDRKPAFYIIQSTVERYSIVHDRSRLAIISGIKQSDAEKILPKLLNIPYSLDGKSSMPQDWMRSVKTIVDKFMPAAKKSVAKLDKKKPDVKTKAIRKIKRRDKPEKKHKRVIKRRSKHS